MTKSEMIALLRSEAAEKLEKAKGGITLEYREKCRKKAEANEAIAKLLEELDD